MSSIDNENDDDTTGYGRPPKKHQFKSGQSGNPRGRPRKAVAETSPAEHWGASLNAIGRIAYDEVTVTIDGKQTKISMIEALHRRRLNDALKGGNRLLQRDVIAQADAHEKEELKRDVDRFYELCRLKSDGEAAIARARAEGCPEPVLVPHPDDINIDDEQTTATIDGPDTLERLVIYDHIVAVRDHLAMRAAYQRRFPPLYTPFTEEHSEGLRDRAELLNNALCKRLRWGSSGFWAAMHPHQKKGYRFLEADIRRSLYGVRDTYTNEPAIAALRNDKHFAKFMVPILEFKTRGRERVMWQQEYKQIVDLLRFTFGEKLVEQLPKLLPTRSYLENIAIIKNVEETRSPEDRAKMEIISKVLQNRHR